MTTHHSDQEGRDKIRELIKDIEIALMVTHDGERLHARPMRAKQNNLNEYWDGKLWFFTYEGSPKVREIETNNHVLLSYSDPKSQNYVSLTGTAHVVRDIQKNKELWAEPLKAWFPNGPEDANIVLIHMHTETAEYWDSPSSLIVHAYGYVKAQLTGQPAKGGDNQKVAF